jgi:hypothetical protein
VGSLNKILPPFLKKHLMENQGIDGNVVLKWFLRK